MQSRKFLKRFFVGLLTISLLTTNCYAINVEIESSFDYNISKDYYQETGNIKLDELDLRTENGKLVYSTKSNTNVKSTQEIALTHELSKNDEIETILAELIDDPEFQNETIVAIGYTNVYLKEEKVNGVSHFEPMTKKEMSNNSVQPSAISHPTTKGKCTVSTVVSIDNFDTSIATAYNYATWKYSAFESPSNRPESSYDDFMTSTHPSNYYLNTDSMSGLAYNAYRQGKQYSSCVWGFKVSEASGKVTLTTGSRRQSVSSSAKEWTTNYVHTWGQISPSFTITPDQISISGTITDKSWMITSYVQY